jgi:hypothetical protein
MRYSFREPLAQSASLSDGTLSIVARWNTPSSAGPVIATHSHDITASCQHVLHSIPHTNAHMLYGRTGTGLLRGTAPRTTRSTKPGSPRRPCPSPALVSRHNMKRILGCITVFWLYILVGQGNEHDCDATRRRPEPS